MEDVARSVRVVQNWLWNEARPSPRAQVVIWRLTVQTLQTHLQELLHVGSERWARTQEALAAATPPQQRQCRVRLAATGAHEQKLLRRIKLLMFDATIWMLLPQDEVSNDTRS